MNRHPHSGINPCEFLPEQENQTNQTRYVLVEYNFYGDRWSWYLFTRTLLSDINPDKIGEVRSACLSADGETATDNHGRKYYICGDDRSCKEEGRQSSWSTAERCKLNAPDDLKHFLTNAATYLQKAVVLLDSIKTYNDL